MSETKDEVGLDYLAQSLEALAPRLEPKEAAQATATITKAMTSPANLNARDGNELKQEPMVHRGRSKADSHEMVYLSHGLAAVAARMEPKDATFILSRAIRKATLPGALLHLTRGLTAVAPRLEQKDAAFVCGKAAGSLTQAMNFADLRGMRQLSQGLVAVSKWLEPVDAKVTLTKAMGMVRDPRTFFDLTEGLAALAARVEPEEAAFACGRAAASLAQVLGSRGFPEEVRPARVPFGYPEDIPEWQFPDEARILSQGLRAVITREPTERTRDRVRLVIAAIGAGASSPLHSLTITTMQAAMGPPPKPLPPQILVDLLKHPLCVSETRRVILDTLSLHYHRPFADQWDFVRFAREQKLGLDLTTPPQRPEQAAPAIR